MLCTMHYRYKRCSEQNRLLAPSIESRGHYCRQCFIAILPRWSSGERVIHNIYTLTQVQYELCQSNTELGSRLCYRFYLIDISNDALTWTTVLPLPAIPQTNIINYHRYGQVCNVWMVIARATGFAIRHMNSRYLLSKHADALRKPGIEPAINSVHPTGNK